jgi:protein-S-isoprenylcysteine O-methyltransferase Ste14
MIWARLSLGRSIGLVPALRSLVTHGAYRYVRHPIYLAGSLIFVANMLSAYSPANLAVLALGIFWFALKSVVEESFLRSDPRYADYMERVRWRSLPGIA